MAANQVMAAGAIDALARRRQTRALVVGINGTKEAIDAVKGGTMLATDDYNGFLQGCIGNPRFRCRLRHQSIPDRHRDASRWVSTRTTTQSYDMMPDKQTCPSWDRVAAQ